MDKFWFGKAWPSVNLVGSIPSQPHSQLQASSFKTSRSWNQSEQAGERSRSESATGPLKEAI